MAARCPGSSPLFLPFLYPPLFLRNGRCLAARLSSRGPARRYHMTETAPPLATAHTRLNPAPDDYAISSFADKATLQVYAGGGGHGCISFLRELFLPEGPPNGGDGGHGGNIYIQAVPGETSLHKLARTRVIRAGRGKHGQGSARNGQRGEDVIITVPVGTIVRELERYDPAAEEAALIRATRRRRPSVPPPSVDGETEVPEPPQEEDPLRYKWLVYPGLSSTEAKNVEFPKLPRRDRLFAQPAAPINLDLSKPTPQPILLAAGGIGGLGNAHFVTKQTRRPLYATKGDRPMTMTLEFELRLLADVGLVGLPNAGKSTLLRALSNSRARVGSWAFTTLQPNIGTVVLDNNKGRPVVNSVRRQPLPADLDSASDEEETEVVRRTRFTVADIPGLIEGAHLDKGLGMEFLRHVERAGVLAFVIDLSAGNAVEALKALWKEVGLYAQMREDEEVDREREARIEWDANNAASRYGSRAASRMMIADYPQAPESAPVQDIAGKPWFVVATKGDLPGSQENFRELRDYLAAIERGDLPHPSGIEEGWTEKCAAIPVSAINGHGVDRIVHWVVGLLDS